jgi:hypothetical protein
MSRGHGKREIEESMAAHLGFIAIGGMGAPTFGHL